MFNVKILECFEVCKSKIMLRKNKTLPAFKKCNTSELWVAKDLLHVPQWRYEVHKGLRLPRTWTHNDSFSYTIRLFSEQTYTYAGRHVHMHAHTQW